MDPKYSSNLSLLDSISAFLNLDPDATQKHMFFILSTVENLLTSPDNEEYRQFIFPDSNFEAHQFIIQFFENNGFIKAEVDSQIYLMYTDPSVEPLQHIPELIRQNYLFQRSEKASDIADRYENRQLNQMIKKSSETNIKSEKQGSFPLNNKDYQQKREQAENELNDYRTKMKERHNVEQQSSNKRNSGTLVYPEIPEKKSQPLRDNDRISFEMNPIKPPVIEEKTKNRDNLFAFQSRRDNEKRIEDAQNQMSEYREEMKRRAAAQGSNKSLFSNREVDPKVLQAYEDYDKILSENLKAKGLDKKMTGSSMVEIEKRRIEEDKVRFGIKALALSNEFRKKNGLWPLMWSSRLCDIAMPHSKNMAEGKVPLGHDGFNKRADAIDMPHELTCENVAFSDGYGDSLPETIVNSWINSEGHRKNLLSMTNSCGIAVYRSDNGTWYFTQLLSRISPSDNRCNLF